MAGSPPGRGDGGALWRAVQDAEAAAGLEGLSTEAGSCLLPGDVWPNAWGAELIDEQSPGRYQAITMCTSKTLAAALHVHSLTCLALRRRHKMDFYNVLLYSCCLGPGDW